MQRESLQARMQAQQAELDAALAARAAADPDATGERTLPVIRSFFNIE